MLFVLKRNSSIDVKVDISNSDNTVEDDFESVIAVEDKKSFFTVANCISNTIKDDVYFVPLRMNVLQGTGVDTYSVYGFATDINYENFQYAYYIVKLDVFNNTYSVELLNQDYKDLENIDLKNDEYEIKDTGNNTFSYINADDKFILNTYMEYCKMMLLANPELIYDNFLEIEYKNEKFSDIEEFRKYIDANRNNIENMMPVQYSIDNFSDYSQYTIKDIFDNYYIIKEKSVMNFTILLDNYTVNSSEFDDKYKNSSDEVKITTNVDKIFKMINNKEYKSIYDKYLNNNFKSNYFSNYTDFENFIYDKFFDYNYLGSLSVESRGAYYIINVNYKEGISSAAEERNISMIMKLNDDTDFEMSFQM